ncbi:PAS domain-containing sensor histidine kinase [Cytobacillus dafuensis]|uniref:histidine kinase n=1 Tax=Cytobacillus dafuensis TaxID=1742359 RepID=A0A5B8ZA01_CYTDA|nr:PAS domain S-box protein [Cytobacillus dafuensis]QED49818.1 PAS domain S-box protein [Cytobacillus dafuensis]
MLDKINVENPQLFIHAFENAGIGMAIISLDGKLLKVNQSLCTSFGYTAEEVLHLSMKDLLHPDDLAIDKLIIQELTEGKRKSYQMERRYIHKDNHEIWAIMNVSLVRDENDQPRFYISQIQDISVQLRTVAKLRESEERYHRLVEESPDGVIILKEERCVFINKTGVELLGLSSKKDIIGRTIFDFIHKKDHKAYKKRDFCRESVGPLEKRFIRMDGKIITVELKAIPTTFRDEPAVHVNIRDISASKKAQELMINSEKLTIAGQLAAGIAHEVRNPLTAIKGFFQMMEKDVTENKLYFDVIGSEINRIEVILNELLLLAKPQEAKFEFKNIEVILNHVLTLLESQTNLNNIQIIKNIEPSIPLIKCDENQLKQVFINFLKNSIEAMPRGGMIHIDVLKQSPTSILIRIVDQGSGIPEHLLNRIGEPFFTTKEKGTGLGLMICKNIIEEHKGKIKIESSPSGTRIEIHFPTS